MKALKISTLAAILPLPSPRFPISLLLSLPIHFGFESAVLARTPLYKEEPKPSATAEVIPKPLSGSPSIQGNNWSHVVQGNPIVLPSQPVTRSDVAGSNRSS